MVKNKMTMMALGLLILSAMGAAAQDPTHETGFRTAAEIRIALPEVNAAGRVSIWPSESRVVLDLPSGAEFPMDFASASGGLLTRGNVVPVSDDRVRLELDLAHGLLDGIDYEADAVVLHFHSRFENLPASTEEDRYLIGPEDKLEISVHGHPDLSRELTVNRDGTITTGLLGDVAAGGLTPHQLANKLAERLGRDYLVDPQVDVAVVEFMSQWVMAAGELKLSGRIPLRGGTRLKEIIGEAGGFTDYGGEEITISRRQPDTDDFVLIEVPRPEFESGQSNPLLAHGDIITVARAAFCYVHGEVNVPTRVRIERGITLLKALTLAGGLTDWANRKQIKILYGDGMEPRIVNLKQIHRGKEEDPVLLGGEIIVVQRRFFLTGGAG